MSDPATRRRWAPPAVWAAIMLVASSWPSPDLPNPGHADKVVHVLLYALLAWLVGRALSPLARAPGRLALVLLALAAFAAVDEWHQSFIPGRSASLADWWADAAGALLGLLPAARRRPLAHSAP